MNCTGEQGKRPPSEVVTVPIYLLPWRDDAGSLRPVGPAGSPTVGEYTRALSALDAEVRANGEGPVADEMRDGMDDLWPGGDAA